MCNVVKFKADIKGSDKGVICDFRHVPVSKVVREFSRVCNEERLRGETIGRDTNRY